MNSQENRSHSSYLTERFMNGRDRLHSQTIVLCMTKNEYKFPKKFRKPARNTDMVYGPSDSEVSLYLEGVSSVGALLPLYLLL